MDTYLDGACMPPKDHMQGASGKKCGASEGIAAVWANVPIVAEMLGTGILPASIIEYRNDV